jgi:excinuclease UvrABC nuclease subunit
MKRECKRIRSLFQELLHAPRKKFPAPREKLDAPNRQGVYIVYSPNNHVVHVGRTPSGANGIRQRLKNHLHNESSFTTKYLDGRGSALRKKYSFRYLIVKNRRQRALLEAYAIGCLCPLHLGVGAAKMAK